MKLYYFLVMSLLVTSSFAIAQPGMLMICVGGIIEIDDIPIGGITVQVENLNTGEYKTTTTAYDTPYTKCGYYIVDLTGQEGDVIKVTVTYGNTYSNTTIVDISQVTLFYICNISISTDEPYEPPDDPPYNPPSNGDEPDEPETPEDNETEEPPDEPPENDTDNDICNLYNLTVEVTDNTTGDPISNASVTVYRNDSMVSKSYTNDTGIAAFLLEEGEYAIEITKDNYKLGSRTVNFLCSTEYTIPMETESNPNPTPAQEEGTPIYFYVIVAVAIIIIISIFVYHYRRR